MRITPPKTVTSTLSACTVKIEIQFILQRRSSPQSSNPSRNESVLLGDLCGFLTKTLRINKAAMNKFLKESIVRNRHKDVGTATHL